MENDEQPAMLSLEQGRTLAAAVSDLQKRVAELERVSYEQVLVNYDLLLAFHDVVGVALVLRAPSVGDFSKEMGELEKRLTEIAPRLKVAQIGSDDDGQ